MRSTLRNDGWMVVFYLVGRIMADIHVLLIWNKPLREKKLVIVLRLSTMYFPVELLACTSISASKCDDILPESNGT